MITVDETAAEPVVAAVEPTETTEDQAVDTEQTTDEVKAPAWKAQMKGDLKDNEYFDQFATISDAGKELLSLKEQKERSVVMPSEEGTEEEIKEFYSKLGRPEDTSGYEFELPEIPKGMKHNKESEEAFRKLAFDSGLTQKQAATFFSNFNKQGVEIYQAAIRRSEKKREEAGNILKAEWAEDYKGNMAVVERALTTFASEEERTQIDKDGFGNNTNLVKMLHRIGKAVTEDKFIGGAVAGVDDELDHLGTHKIRYKT